MEIGDLRDRANDRTSCSTVEEDLVAATSMDGSTLSTIDAPLLRRYQQGTPRAGYRGSDFVPWHQADHPRRSENIVGFLMDSRSAGAAPGLSAAGVINLRRPIGDSQKNEKIVTVTQMTRALKSTAI